MDFYGTAVILQAALKSYFICVYFIVNLGGTAASIIHGTHSTTAHLQIKRSYVNCNNSSSRVDCGWDGITKNQCDEMACCFDSGNPHVANCFIGQIETITQHDSCSFEKPRERTSCGDNGITKAQCEEINCCFDNRVYGVPNCFHYRDSSLLASSPAISDGLQKSDIDSLIRAQTITIDSLLLLKQNIQKLHRDHSIAKTVGSSVGTASTILLIGGIVLAPFTGYASLALTVGGLTGTILGGGTTLVTSIIQTKRTKAWADELERSLDGLGEELQRINRKIITSPDWKRYLLEAGKGAINIATRVPSAVRLGRILKYLVLVSGPYGGELGIKAPALFFAIQGLPGKSLIAANNWLGRTLANHGINVGFRTLRAIHAAIGVVGIGFDIYTIVDTWTNRPAAEGEIEKIVAYLQENKDKLNQLKNEM